MARKHRTRDEAIEQSPHLLYEIQMLGALRLHFLTGDHDAAVAGLPLEGLASRNALVEAFQVHARQLIYFLTDKRDDREATASDFVAGGWKIPAGEAGALGWMAGDFSQRVAHLSWRRSGAKSVQAAVLTEDIFDAIRRHLLVFLEKVDSSRVQPRFVAEATEALFVETSESGSASDSLFTINPAVLRATNYPGGTATKALQPPPPDSA